jgi:hypothetical protein
MAKQSCRNCNNFDKGICSVLNDVLLIMTRIVNSKGETVMDAFSHNSLVIKDKHLDSFKCNKYVLNEEFKNEN